MAESAEWAIEVAQANRCATLAAVVPPYVQPAAAARLLAVTTHVARMWRTNPRRPRCLLPTCWLAGRWPAARPAVAWLSVERQRAQREPLGRWTVEKAQRVSWSREHGINYADVEQIVPHMPSRLGGQR